MTRTPWTLGLLLLGLAPACGDKDVDDTDSTAVEADADTDADTDSDADSDVQPSAQLSGVITDESGGPVVGARVSMCRFVCRTAETDATGAYEMPLLEAFTHSFEVAADTDGLSTPLVPLTMLQDGVVELNAVVPRLSPYQPTPSTAAEVELTEGLFVTIGQEGLELPFGGDGTRTSAVRLRPEWWLPVEVEGEVLAMWYLAPFDAHPESGGLAFRIRNDLDLASGTSVHAWAADYTQSAWLDAGVMTVSDDGLWLENDGTGLPVFATLVLVR